MSLSINVRLPKNKSQIIDISKATTVHGIKEEISKIIETDVNMFNLLFAGKVLNPEASIQVNILLFYFAKHLNIQLYIHIQLLCVIIVYL